MTSTGKRKEDQVMLVRDERTRVMEVGGHPEKLIFELRSKRREETSSDIKGTLMTPGSREGGFDLGSEPQRSWGNVIWL